MQDQVDILLVEDEKNDAFFMKKAFESLGVGRSLCVAHDGQDALDFLFCKGEHENAPRPRLILMDINMPRKTGHEVLREVKVSEKLKNIPIIMYSSSTIPEDIHQSYTYHANVYVSKPKGFEKMLEFVKVLNDFWFVHASLSDS